MVSVSFSVSVSVELRVVVVHGHQVQPQILLVHLKHRLELEAFLLHGDYGPHFSLIFPQFLLVARLLVLFQLLSNSVLKFHHVLLQHLLVRLSQWHSFLHMREADLTETIRLFCVGRLSAN